MNYNIFLMLAIVVLIAQEVQLVAACEVILMRLSATLDAYRDLASLRTRLEAMLPAQAFQLEALMSYDGVVDDVNSQQSQQQQHSQRGYVDQQADQGEQQQQDHLQQQSQDASPTSWRVQLPAAQRRRISIRVINFLALAAVELAITSSEDVAIKTQLFEVALLITAPSLKVYLDGSSLLRRLSALIADFYEFLAVNKKKILLSG